MVGLFAAQWRQGVCHRQYYVRLLLHPDPAFADAPWSTFEWALLVDGAQQYPQSVGSPGGYEGARCSPDSVGAAPGPHSFEAVAAAWVETRAPVAYWAPRVAFTIDCASATRVDYHTSAPLTPEEIAFWDTDVDGSCGGTPMDASVDAARSLDASLDGAAHTMDGGTAIDGAPHTEPDTQPTCTAAPRHAPPAPLALALLALLAVARGRRRLARPRE